MTPAISIVVPVYRVEPYLRQCVDSILAQTLRDFELILVDDGSPDNCPAICDEYAARDGRVKVIHKKNGGLVSAWKAGVAAASADRVGFVDSDDWVDDSFFADLYAGAVELDADVVVGERTEEYGETGALVFRREKTVLYRGKEDIRRLLTAFYTSFLHDEPSRRPITYARWDKLYRRDLLMANMSFFDEGISLDEDRIANSAVLADCRTAAVLAGTGKYHYRILSGSMFSGYGQAKLEQLGRFSDAMLAVADAKGLDRAPVMTFLGGTAYRRIYLTARQRDLSVRERCARIRRLLTMTPPGALDRYARDRGGPGIRLFCAMLRAGLIAPCVWSVSAHAAASGGT